MTSVLRGGRRLAGLAFAALAANMAVSVPLAHAQDTVEEIRLRKLEAEVRALQRQVFPGGDGKYFPSTTPPPAPVTTTPVGTPATTPVTDLLTRMDAVEAQIARLTAQNEEMSNHLRQIDARLGTGQAAPAPADAAAPADGVVAPPAPTAPPPAPTPLLSERPAKPAPLVATKPSAQRLAAVRAIVKPDSGDAGEDDYTYGFKLWQAKFYPEAEQQLKLFLDKYPRHPRVSYARNLLGRAFLDEGKPREAAPWFLQNYQSNKHGDRAADSLLFLAEAMVELKDTNRACIALAEFSDTYASEAAGRLKSQYAETRASVKCN